MAFLCDNIMLLHYDFKFCKPAHKYEGFHVSNLFNISSGILELEITYQTM